MAVPKKKTSHSKTRMRRSHWHLSAPGRNRCTNCDSPCRPHRVCRKCGHYGDREIMVVES